MCEWIIKKTIAILIGALLSLFTHVSGAEFVENPGSVSLLLKAIPPRPNDAITGSEFARRTAGMPGADRQKAALKELHRGNIPDFLRKLKPIRMTYAPPQGEGVSGTIWVMPDYLAIGSEEDFLRMPLTFSSAIEIANDFGFTLPTRKIVDVIFKNSTCHLEPEHLPPGPEMRSSEYYLRHREMIRAQRRRAGCALGQLTSGHKKDVVLTNLLHRKPHRLPLYGWHRRSGKPIQPLSTVHDAEYADYSHGLRLVSQTVWIDEKPRSIFDVLQDPNLAPLLTYEGEILKPRSLMGQKR